PEPAGRLDKLPGMEVRSIDFGRLAGGVQHAKYFVVDGRTTFLGSQNLDWRALKHIHELGVCIRDSAATRVYADLFELDWRMAGDTARADAQAEVARAAHRYAPPFLVPMDGGDTVSLWPGYTPRGWIPDSALRDLPN